MDSLLGAHQGRAPALPATWGGCVMLRIERYGNSRFWALYDGQDLVVVTVYKRGAREVQRRLAAQPRG